MKIEFYVAKDQTIPTELRLKVDEAIDVYYKRLAGAFGYELCFLKSQVTLGIAEAITDEIVSRMISQSYDHGAQWRECGVRKIEENDWEVSITVFFRVRDAG